MTLIAGQKYWAFQMQFRNHARATCAGCGPACIFVLSALIESYSDPDITVTFYGGPQPFVELNGAHCMSGTPVVPSTWGAIKALYR